MLGRKVSGRKRAQSSTVMVRLVLRKGSKSVGAASKGNDENLLSEDALSN